MRYRLQEARSRARVTAYAPGHRFSAEGVGITGTIDLETDRLLHAEATFPLAALDAGDRLGNHELRKFLGLEKGPLAQGEIKQAIALETTGAGSLFGEGRLVISIGERREETTIRIRGTRPRAVATFTLSFTGLGYAPPSLLFLKAKDTIDVEITVEIEERVG